jgi:hypothetical protein
MADRVLLITWSAPVRGREERGLEVFNEAIGLYGQMQQAGRIDSFDVALIDPTAGDIDGYIILHGSAEQMSAVREADDFLSVLNDAAMVVDGLRMAGGSTGADMGRDLERYQAAIAKVLEPA